MFDGHVYALQTQGDRLKATPGLPEVANHDYFVSQRAFFFDLSVWADEAPVDDPAQTLGQDKAELVAIFEACYAATQAPGYQGPQMLHIGGFTPWWCVMSCHNMSCWAQLSLLEQCSRALCAAHLAECPRVS